MDEQENSAESIVIESQSGLPEAAGRLLTRFPDQRIFAFYGKMGAGKTTLIKHICAKLGAMDEATSPTFAIINVYHSRNNDELYHFDFYRINDVNEVMDIGYEEYFFSGNYCFIEWPEKIESILPEEALKVNISIDEESERRVLHFERS